MDKKSINVWQLTRDECARLKDLTPILVLNTVSNNYTLEIASPKGIYNSEKCPSANLFFTLQEPIFKEEKC